jgi:hypothetical protein
MIQPSTHSGLSQPSTTTLMSQSPAFPAAPAGFALDATQPARLPGDGTTRSRLERMVHGIDRSLPLPTTPRGYLLYLCGLILITGGMGILTLMSAQILEAKAHLRQLTAEHEKLQQSNSELVWLIARESNLERIQRRLAGKGYVAVTDVEYVVLGGAEPLVPAVVQAPTQPETTTPPALAALPAAMVESHAPRPELSLSASNTTAWNDAPAGWLHALSEGFGRWEALFAQSGLTQGLERPAASTRSQNSTTQMPGAQDFASTPNGVDASSTGSQAFEPEIQWTGSSWLEWWQNLELWSFDRLPALDSLPALEEVLPWLSE